MNMKRSSMLSIVLCLCLVMFTACSPLDPSTPSVPSVNSDGERWLRMAVGGPPDLDPAYSSSWSRLYCYLNLYDSLVMYDSYGKLTPLLAESWKSSDDGLTYTFELKKGAKFHDNTEVTASDVAFSLKRLNLMGSGFNYLFADIVKSVETPDDYTVVFNLNHVYGAFLETLTRLYVVNEDLIMANLNMNHDTFKYDQYGDLGRTFLQDNDAGSGPYQCEEISQQNYLIAAAFTDYHLPWPENAPTKIKIINNTEPATVRTMLATRELELSDNWQSSESLDAMSNIDGVEVAPFSMSAQQQLNLNISMAPTDDVYFRKALACLLDYASIAESVFPDSIVAVGPSNVNTPGSATKLSTNPYAYNLEKAREYLAQSRYAGQLDEYPVEFFCNSSNQAQEKIALSLQVAAKQVGITVKVTSAPLTTQQERNTKSDTTPNIETYSFAPYYWDAGAIFEAHYSKKNEGNGNNTMWLSKSDWGNVISPVPLRSMDDWANLITDAIRIKDDTERYEAYAQLEQIIMDNVWNIPVACITERVAYQADYVMWPSARHYKNTGELAATAVGYQFWFRDFEVYNDKIVK